VVEDELADALVLTADDNEKPRRDLAGKGVEGDIPPGVKGGDGVTGVEGFLDIGDGIAVPGDVEELDRSGGYLAHRGVDLGDAPGGEKDVMKTKYLGGAEDGPDVMGILDIVEEKDPAGLKTGRVGNVGIAGGFEDDVLMLGGPAKLVQATLVGELNGDAGLIEEAAEGLQARTGGALLVQMRFEDAPATGPEAFKGRVEAVKEFG